MTKENNLEYYNLLASSMIQFIKSLDSMDLTNSLPLLWGAIETLVKKNNESKYDDFIKRCSFLYRNDTYVINLLELIKEHRNNFVHNGLENVGLVKLFLIELEKIYKNLFFFHLKQAKKKYSFENTIEILSCTKDITILKSKKKCIEDVIRFVSLK